MDMGFNMIHGSDAPETAAFELGLWFPEGLMTGKTPWAHGSTSEFLSSSVGGSRMDETDVNEEEPVVRGENRNPLFRSRSRRSWKNQRP